MWLLALILSVLIEAIFIMHHADPDYFGIPLGLYQILRVVAVIATVFGALGLWRTLAKKKRATWLAVVLFVPTLAPTVHWIVANSTFRVQMVLARGDVKARKLVAYLKSYPDTKPASVSRWLFKQKRSREPRPVFIGRQLADLLMWLPDGMAKRYEGPLIKSALGRLRRFEPDKQLLGFAAMLRRTRRSRSTRARRVGELAGAQAMTLRLKTLDGDALSQLAPGVRRLVGDLRARKVALPASVKLVLGDKVEGKAHVSLRLALGRCRLLHTIGALGLTLDPAAERPTYTLKIERTVETVKTTFRKGSRRWHDMTLPLYTLDLQLVRADGGEVFGHRVKTNRGGFRFVMSYSGSRAGFQSELYRRAVRGPCRALRELFASKGLYPEVKSRWGYRRGRRGRRGKREKRGGPGTK